ncbi:hypothetical protein [Pluralibacter gergoviae]|uniref:hypothetical protein n=1 Tax=Pluralibacter gergoviae TaxID=61647 RepID=UPI0006AC2B1D|nr:hypothetical protein [Pluralibacter gergoviae]KOQ95787.1 hypothetical protein ABW48_16230 [Pluralibacter gergoviae]
MDALKQRILDYITANRPATATQIRTGLSITKRQASDGIKSLKALDKIHVAVAFGCFVSQEDFERWKETAGREVVIARTRNANGSPRTRQRNNTYAQKIKTVLSERPGIGSRAIADAIGVHYKYISCVLSRMINAGDITATGVCGSRVYSLSTPEQKMRPKRKRSINTVCDECRRSDAQRRIMMVYGRGGV